MKTKAQSTTREHLKKIIVVSMLSAIAYLITFVFRFNVSFLTFDLKDTVLAMVSLIYGPLYGVISALAVTLIEAFSISGTGPYGFIMNFLASATFSFIFGLIYKYKRNFTGAIISAIGAAVTLVCVMLTANLFITPLYMAGAGVDRAAVIGMIPTLLLPFNLCKAILNAALTLMLYKPVTSLLKKLKILKTDNGNKYKLSTKSIVLFVFCFVAAVLSVLFILLGMEGTFSILK